MPVGLAFTVMVELAFSPRYRQAGHRNRLASSRIPLVLHLESSSWKVRTSSIAEPAVPNLQRSDHNLRDFRSNTRARRRKHSHRGHDEPYQPERKRSPRPFEIKRWVSRIFLEE